MNTRHYRTLHEDTNSSKEIACSKNIYGCKWGQRTIEHYISTEIKVKEKVVIGNDIDVNEHKTLSNGTLKTKLK
jgi:hypothetical protein